MSSFRVNEKCVGCLACVENCPGAALAWNDEGGTRTIRHNLARCARSATCWRVCPHGAVEFGSLIAGGWDDVVSLDLVRCSECGAPLGTTRLEAALDPKIADLATSLCDLHRSRRHAGKITGAAHGGDHDRR